MLFIFCLYLLFIYYLCLYNVRLFLFFSPFLLFIYYFELKKKSFNLKQEESAAEVIDVPEQPDEEVEVPPEDDSRPSSSSASADMQNVLPEPSLC